MVASEPAVNLSIFLLVTVDAELHLKVHGPQPVHGLHLSMAVRAIELAPYDVRLVVELDMVRYVINLDPGHGHFVVIVFSFFHKLRMLRDDILVAKKTLLD